MDNIATKYLSPITVEAEIFLNSLESLSKQYNNVDAVLISSLEKIMNAIENFLDSSSSEIVETKQIKLVKCDKAVQISRIFCCAFCKRDIGKSVEKVALHIAEGCPKAFSETHDVPKIKLDVKNRPLSVDKRAATKKSNQDCSEKLNKKTCSLLTTNLFQFIEDNAKIGAKLKCIPAYDKIEKDLIKLVTPLFPEKNIQVYRFGSRIAGIGNRDSDLDLYVDIGDTFNVYQNRADTETLKKLQKVEKALKGASNSWKGLLAVKTARVPILKVIHAESAIECDINFSNSLGVVNTGLLNYIFSLQPITQSLCCYMKKWLSRTKLCDHINTYSMNLLVLFLLQISEPNLIPSMKQLQENIDQEKALKIGHWLCKYGTYSLKELNIEPVRVDQPNMLKYIRKFFAFYTKFDFNRDAISPYLGRTIKKDDLEFSMPGRYIDYIVNFPENKLDVDKPIVIQDPIQLNHNTARNICKSTLEIFKKYMANSLMVLNDHFLEDV